MHFFQVVDWILDGMLVVVVILMIGAIYRSIGMLRCQHDLSFFKSRKNDYGFACRKCEYRATSFRAASQYLTDFQHECYALEAQEIIKEALAEGLSARRLGATASRP